MRLTRASDDWLSVQNCILPKKTLFFGCFSGGWWRPPPSCSAMPWSQRHRVHPPPPTLGEPQPMGHRPCQCRRSPVLKVVDRQVQMRNFTKAELGFDSFDPAPFTEEEDEETKRYVPPYLSLLSGFVCVVVWVAKVVPYLVAYDTGGGEYLAEAKFGVARCGTTKLYHILPRYLRTEARGCRVQNH